MNIILRKYNVDEDGKMYETETEIKSSHIDELEKIDQKIKKLIGLSKKDDYSKCETKMVKEESALYIYNPKSNKAIIRPIKLSGEYLLKTGNSFDEMVVEYKNGKRTGEL